MKHTCYTIVLDFKYCRSFKVRCKVLLRSLTWLLPFMKRRNLSEEYRDWVRRRYLTKTRWKLRWMLDHFLLWIIYCVIVLFKGYVEGGKWEISPEKRR